MYILYDLIFLVFAIVYLPYLIFTRRYHSRFAERFGIFDKGFFDKLKNKEIVWLHAVSVGEVIAASPFIKGFHACFPNHMLLISTVTKTGNNIASRVKDKEDSLIYFPLDLSFVIRRILKRINVKVFIVMETEIWPNIITAFYKKRIPMVLMNGRLSLGSFKAYRKIVFLLKGVLNKINLFCMRTPTDASRLKALGVDENKINITGNMKYDAAEFSSNAEHSKLRLSLGIGNDKKILIAGSTHRGEDEIVINAYGKLLKKIPELMLLIAPRHIERTEEIERVILKNNLKVARFSSLNEDSGDAQVIVLDVMGKLRDLYSISDIVFIGGSLLPNYGGHNPLEPAVFKKPILFGPYMANFKDMADEFLKDDAAKQVRSNEEIEKVCKELLNSPRMVEEMGQRAFDIIEKNKGATDKNTKYIENILISGVMRR